MASDSETQPLDLGRALNGTAPRSRPAAPVASPVAAQMLPATPVAPIALPVPAVVAQLPVAPTTTPAESKKDKKKLAGKKQTFAIEEALELMLEQAAFHTRKSKTYFVNKALKALLKNIPEAQIPIPPQVEDDEDDE